MLFPTVSHCPLSYLYLIKKGQRRKVSIDTTFLRWRENQFCWIDFHEAKLPSTVFSLQTWLNEFHWGFYNMLVH